MVVVANMVDVRFRADVIEYYGLHPEERSEIGTLDGYHRMTGALTDWYRAQPAVRR